MTALVFLVVLGLVFYVAWSYLARHQGPKAKIGPDDTNVREPESFVVHHEGKGQGLDIANTALKERTEDLRRDLPGSTHQLQAPIPGRDAPSMSEPPSDESRYGDIKVPPTPPTEPRGKVLHLRRILRAPARNEEDVLFSPDPAWAMEMAEETDWSLLHEHPALPANYGEDQTVALVRNPRSLYVYWERSGKGDENLRTLLGEAAYTRSRPVLRIHDVTSGAYPGQEGGRVWSVNVNDDDDHCFVCEGIEPGREYVVSYERRTTEGAHYRLSHSAPVRVPHEGPAPESPCDARSSMLYQMYIRQPGDQPGSPWR